MITEKFNLKINFSTYSSSLLLHKIQKDLLTVLINVKEHNVRVKYFTLNTYSINHIGEENKLRCPKECIPITTNNVDSS